MKMNATPKYVTDATFKKASKKIGQNFDSIDKRFEDIDRRFENVDHRFEKIDRRFDQVDRRFEKIDQRLDGLDGKFDRLAVFVVRHDVDIKEIKATLNVTRETGDRILGQLQQFAKKYEESERGARIHLEQLMDFRPQLNDHEKRLVALENRSH